MGNKKRTRHPPLEEILDRPWCYYCERDFEDLKLLISHQKAKHFKCDRCGRRLNTAGGLSVHMNQVHKEALDKVDNALPNRDSLNIEIFGIEGIPEDIMAQHKSRIIQSYYEAQEERRATTGNPPPGQNGEQGPAKKLKIETAEELKKRLDEHKARRTAALQTGGGVLSAARDTQSAGHAASPGAFAPPFPAPQPYGQPGYPHSQYPPSYPPPGGPPMPPGYLASNLPSRPPGTGGSGAAASQGLPQRPPGTYAYPPGTPGAPSTLDDLVSGWAAPQRPAGADQIDQMIRMAEAGIKPAGEPAAEQPAAAKGKKEKSVKMIVAAAEFSLEEMMLQWSGSAGASAAA